MALDAGTGAADAIAIIFNGPALAGVGATTDAGLIPDKHHILPWNPDSKIDVNIVDDGKTVKYTFPSGNPKGSISVGSALKYAIYNVDTVYKWEEASSAVNAVGVDEKNIIRRDLIAIIFVMLAYGYYGQESRISAPHERAAIDAIAVTAQEITTVVTMDSINRAATFILARMHTKYQTNHVLGGSPMQASMASAVRAFYNVNPSTARSDAAKAKVNMIASALHWALHPANETLLIPAVIANSKITKAKVCADGPPITAIGKEEYFAIRANTPPASTHHFYVAAAAVRHLEPLGVIPYMPNLGQLNDVENGWIMIATYGAQLHPAARFWGLERMTANQKIVEPVCANLGYAVRKLMPNSSLAASPILEKEDALDGRWKSFVDALRAALDAKGAEMVDESVMKEIQKNLIPTAGDTSKIAAISRLTIEGSKSV